MRVRVKEDMPEGFVGFYGTSRVKPGEVFVLEDRKGFDKKTKKPYIYKAKDQFSPRWMEKVGSSKKQAEIEDEVPTVTDNA